VSAFCAGILKAAGHRVGLYTSPHLCSFRERIRVDAEPIPEDAVADAMDALGTAIARTASSMFDASTAIALDHFVREGAEYAVLEVGLGGRWDSTTVGTPEASIITRIDYDHQEWLGNTLREIAGEKAAIIRSGFAVSAAQTDDAGRVVAERARQVGVPLLVEGVDLHAQVLQRSLSGQRVSLRGPELTTEAALSMLGRFQATNALLAAATMAHLGIGEGPILAGLERTLWPGRFQVLGGDPCLVLDGAHNPNGAEALAQALDEYFGIRPITLIVGLLRDKDAAAILAILHRVAARLILTQSSSTRAVPPDDLRKALPPGASAEIAESPAEALRLATTGGAKVVCVAGSLSLLGDVLTLRAGVPDVPCPIEKTAGRIGPLRS
jgi:dihydrofolate synthase/folylpolyglutamate synthase